MAVNQSNQGISQAGRRVFFGTNVLLTIFLLTAILVGVTGMTYQFSRSGGGRFTISTTGYRHTLSERSKNVLADIAARDPDARIQISTVYTTRQPGMQREKYFPPLRDYVDEMARFSRMVSVEHIHHDAAKAELRADIIKKFGAPAGAYNEAITQAQTLWNTVESTLQAVTGRIEGLRQQGAWVGRFPPLAKIQSDLTRDLERIEEVRIEVRDLVSGAEMPRYEEAGNRVKELNDNLIQHLESAQEKFEQWNELLAVLGDTDSEFVQETRDKANLLIALALQLQQTVGDPSEDAVPDNPREVIQGFGRQAGKLAEALAAEASRVDTFVKANPSISQHPMWSVEVQQAIFVSRAELPWILNSSAEDLINNRERVRQILMENQPDDILKNVVRQLRQIAQQHTQRVQMWADQVIKVFADDDRIDQASREFVKDGAEGRLVKETLDQLKELGTTLSDLPEIEIDEIGNKLQNENLVIIGSGDKVEVLTFDDVWPIADQRSAPLDDDEEQFRIFDADTAISGALISMTSEEPVARVVFTIFEPQSQNPMMGPSAQPPLPVSLFNTVKERLRKANFEVEDWNLAAEGEESEPPAIKEGEQAIYVIFPPAITMQNPFQRQQQPPREFGPQDMAKIERVLADGGRGLFLNLVYYQSPFPFMPSPEYDYAGYLEDEWGIDVMYDRRVIKGVIDPAQPSRFGITVNDWVHMSLSTFTEHPIGKPLRNRRMLMTEVVPVLRAEVVPEGVTIEPVLEVPANANDYWAERDVARIIRALQTGESDSTFLKGDNVLDPPFSVIVAATKRDADAAETRPAGVEAQDAADDVSRIVVFGAGSALEDRYLTRRVMRFEGRQQRLVTDPPPMENIDLFINAVYWLADRPDLIASGPAEVRIVEHMDPSTRRSLGFVTLGWAAAVLMAGVVVFFVRRK